MGILSQGGQRERQAYFLLLHKVHDNWALSRRRRALGNEIGGVGAGASWCVSFGFDTGEMFDMSSNIEIRIILC
jgi:hypothetical protein